MFQHSKRCKNSVSFPFSFPFLSFSGPGVGWGGVGGGATGGGALCPGGKSEFGPWAELRILGQTRGHGPNSPRPTSFRLLSLSFPFLPFLHTAGRCSAKSRPYSFEDALGRAPGHRRGREPRDPADAAALGPRAAPRDGQALRAAGAVPPGRGKQSSRSQPGVRASLALFRLEELRYCVVDDHVRRSMRGCNASMNICDGIQSLRDITCTGCLLPSEFGNIELVSSLERV